MNLFFETSGDFKAGTVLTKSGESFQVELIGGKRAKVRARDVLIEYSNIEPAQLIEQAKRAAEDIDLDFLWEVAGADEFSFSELGLEYFGHAPLPHESAALLYTLHTAPIYFYKRGKGRYKAAPEENLRAAQASVERKKQQGIIQDEYTASLINGVLPIPFEPLVLKLLFSPDKNSIEFKALSSACSTLQLSPQALMLQVGAISSALELHRAKFVSEHFAKGVSHKSDTFISPSLALPRSNVRAFSVDDASTTEIDDAFSVTWEDDGRVRVGIHIAAPALGFKPESEIDQIASSRLSTVYIPGEKITMMPESLIRAFSLDEGDFRPSISLYAYIDPTTFACVSTETCVESVFVESNLRHNDLDDLVTAEGLSDASVEFAFKDEIHFLWQWAQCLSQARLDKRIEFGLKAEQSNYVDYNFYIKDDHVHIIRRERGSPLDQVVSELMIFANSSWGKYLDDHSVPGIYRTQGRGGAAGWMQVKMTAHAAPHQGLGVDQYAWCTSPLRRYTDLVNQWQIIACVENGITAPFVAPFKPKDTTLFAIISRFDATYSAYTDFQNQMERYWCLRWLEQEQVEITEATIMKDELVRLREIPLVLRMPTLTQSTTDPSVRLRIGNINYVDLSVDAHLIGNTADEEDDSLISSTG